MIKASIYVRVSTGTQDTANQLSVLTDWAKQRGYEVVSIYQEEESAWRNGHQRRLASLITDARHRKFQAVLVWALDRLSREGALAILSLVQKLSACGVKVLSYQESWTEAPGEIAELLYALTGWVARMESQRRSERTKAGLARVRAQGKRLGRPPGSNDKRKRRRRQIFAVL
jgi:DNA invertase Pin-like site-specific DNA recombinase